MSICGVKGLNSDHDHLAGYSDFSTDASIYATLIGNLVQ